MIVRDFFIKEMKLRYYVGVNQISLDVNQLLKKHNLTGEKEVLDYLFKVVQETQDNNEGSVIQFINNKYVLSLDHIFIACYYFQKAFFQKTNISNKRNIEFLLYLSTYRQINKAIDAFGVNLHDLEKGNVIICIISPINNIDKINNEILQVLYTYEIEITINRVTQEKINTIIKKYEILDSQINSVMKTYNKRIIDSDDNLETLSLAVLDLIYEKMALLNLERGKLH